MEAKRKREDLRKAQGPHEDLPRDYLRQKDILDNVPDIAWLKDREGRFVVVNEAFGKACGLRPEDLVGKTDFDIWPKELAEKYRAADLEVMRTGTKKQLEEPLLDKDGNFSWMETIRTPIVSDWGQIIGTAGIARDITGRKRIEEELRAMSLRDDLTGLYNRRGLFFLAEHHLRVIKRMKSRPFLLFLDLDRMKWINDTFGHPEGDRALKELAELMRKTFRESDILARFGGDEFVVFGGMSSLGTTQIIISRLLSHLEERNKSDSRYRLSVSIGAVEYPSLDFPSLEEMIVQADNLMYQDKQKKGGLGI